MVWNDNTVLFSLFPGRDFSTRHYHWQTILVTSFACTCAAKIAGLIHVATSVPTLNNNAVVDRIISVPGEPAADFVVF